MKYNRDSWWYEGMIRVGEAIPLFLFLLLLLFPLENEQSRIASLSYKKRRWEGSKEKIGVENEVKIVNNRGWDMLSLR